MIVQGEALFGFFLAFMITPFGEFGYFFLGIVVLWEIFVHYNYWTSPIWYPYRMYVILMTIFGRFLGELAWPWILTRPFKK